MFFIKDYRINSLTAESNIDKFILGQRGDVMSFHEDLVELKQKVRQDLEVGASIQSIVEKHFVDIKGLLRSKKAGHSGPFTTKQLAEHFGTGYFALRGALRRAEKKKDIKQVRQVQRKTEVKRNTQTMIAQQAIQGAEVNEGPLILRVSQNLKEVLETVNSYQNFLLDLEDGSDVYKMVYREERDGFTVFDAFAREGRSRISKQIKFNSETGFL